MLLVWIIETLTRTVTYKEKDLFYKTNKDVLTEAYY